jgi:hypothetical protein
MGVMKNILQKIAITWIAVMGIIGIYKERQTRMEDKGKNAPQQQEVMLDEFEIATFHNN